MFEYFKNVFSRIAKNASYDSEHFKKMSFFEENNLIEKRKDFISIINRLKYQKREPKSYVIKHGDIGDQFYIILRGQVAVWLPITNLAEIVAPVEKFKRHLQRCIKDQSSIGTN